MPPAVQFEAIGRSVRRSGDQFIVRVDYMRKSDGKLVGRVEHKVKSKSAIKAAVDAQLTSLKNAQDEADANFDIVGKVLGTI